MRCVDCGCSEHSPCIDFLTGGPCGWAYQDPPVCSSCALDRGILLGIVIPQPLTRDMFECVPIVEVR